MKLKIFIAMFVSIFVFLSFVILLYVNANDDNLNVVAKFKSVEAPQRSGRISNSSMHLRHQLTMKRWGSRESHLCEEMRLSGHRYLSNAELDHSSFIPPILYSFPGSGNTWCRMLIEWATGVHSGSFFSDRTLIRYLPGELHCDRTVSIIKSHPHFQSYNFIVKESLRDNKCRPLEKKFNKIIFLVRDPYDSIWSEFQRKKSGSHTRTLSRSHMSSFRKSGTHLTSLYVNMWKEYYAFRNDSNFQMIVVKYEDLKNETLRGNVLQHIVDFIDIPKSYQGTFNRTLTAKQLECSFILSDTSFAHRQKNPFQLKSSSILSKTDVYDEKTVCSMWKLFGQYASMFGYHPFGGFQCDNEAQ